MSSWLESAACGDQVHTDEPTGGGMSAGPLERFCWPSTAAACGRVHPRCAGELYTQLAGALHQDQQSRTASCWPTGRLHRGPRRSDHRAGLSLAGSRPLKQLYRDLAPRSSAPLVPSVPVVVEVSRRAVAHALGRAFARHLRRLPAAHPAPNRDARADDRLALPAVQQPRGVVQPGRSADPTQPGAAAQRPALASTAAPAFFPPAKLNFGKEPHEFVYGAVTAHNNPALQLFCAATVGGLAALDR